MSDLRLSDLNNCEYGGWTFVFGRNEVTSYSVVTKMCSRTVNSCIDFSVLISRQWIQLSFVLLSQYFYFCNTLSLCILFISILSFYFSNIACQTFCCGCFLLCFFGSQRIIELYSDFVASCGPLVNIVLWTHISERPTIGCFIIF